jgi:hypothetical protein
MKKILPESRIFFVVINDIYDFRFTIDAKPNRKS